MHETRVILIRPNNIGQRDRKHRISIENRQFILPMTQITELEVRQSFETMHELVLIKQEQIEAPLKYVITRPESSFTLGFIFSAHFRGKEVSNFRINCKPVFSKL